MNAVTSAAVVLCTCTVACVVIKMLLPEGRTRKIMNLIISAFLIIVMIAPIKNLFNKSDGLNISTPDESKIMQEYDSKVLSVTQDNLSRSVSALLAQNNINVSNVYVSVKSSGDGGIIIDYINIYIDEDDRPQIYEIIAKTEENFGITPEIILEK